MDEHAKIPRALVDQLFDPRRHGHRDPRDAYGGAGGRFFHSVLAVEELSRVDPSIGVLVDVQNTLVINAFLRWGNDDIKRRYLTRLAADTVGAYALSEAGSGSDAFALTTRAREDGDDYVINGRKLWITNGNEADIFIVFATINPEAGYRGITAFIVERGFAGFTVGKKEDKLGIRASSTCELILEDCRVPKANVLGEVGKGYKTAIETLNEGRIGIGAQMIGLARGALERHHQLHEGAQAVRQGDRRVPGRPAPDRARRRGRRSRDAHGLQRGAPARRRPAVPHRSRDLQDPLVGGRRARRVARGQPVRRQRLRQGVSGREVLSATPRSARSTKAPPTCSCRRSRSRSSGSLFRAPAQ